MSDAPGLSVDALSVLVDGQQLHVTHLRAQRGPLLAPLLMLPGYLSDARVFGDETRGLAQYLARCGYDVYVPDPHGHGRSWPHTGRASCHDFHALINQDLPALAARIATLRPGAPQVWISHGWGAVWMAACYARHHADLPAIAGFVHLAPQRRVLARSWRQRWYYHGLLRGLARFGAALLGYLPASRWGMGVADASWGALRDYLAWSAAPAWCDRRDGFDYRAAALACDWPPSLNLSAPGFGLIGHPDEVRLFLADLPAHDCQLLLSAVDGQGECDDGQFPRVLGWLGRRYAVPVG